jgi:metal-dependent amidase/aminoacylase/carboxypeptidase family protein
MFGVGSGENTPALHNPDYNFPDEIIPYGVKMFRGIIDKLIAT